MLVALKVARAVPITAAKIVSSTVAITVTITTKTTTSAATSTAIFTTTANGPVRNLISVVVNNNILWLKTVEPRSRKTLKNKLLFKFILIFDIIFVIDKNPVLSTIMLFFSATDMIG